MRSTPREVVIDSGPIIALLDRRDAYHAHALEFVERTQARLVTSIAVITEAMYTLVGRRAPPQNLLAWIEAGGLTLRESEATDFARIAELLEKYADLPMDFADAVVVALCERLDILHVASVDRHFSIYRFKGRTKFNNVFFA